MKTKDLIAELQKLDPTGEAECCVGNQDIWYLDGPLPGYYDGKLEVLERDGGGHVVGARITGRDTKIKIRVLGIEELLLDEPGVPVTTAGIGRQEEYDAMITEWRAAGRGLYEDMYATTKKEIDAMPPDDERRKRYGAYLTEYDRKRRGECRAPQAPLSPCIPKATE